MLTKVYITNITHLIASQLTTVLFTWVRYSKNRNNWRLGNSQNLCNYQTTICYLY